MRKNGKRFNQEQIIYALRQVEGGLGQRRQVKIPSALSGL